MTTKPRIIVPRPTGKDKSKYTRFQRWSFRRWAWEFLRRNTNFKQDSDAAGQDLVLRKAVAEKYYLKRFKPYLEGFSGLSGRPIFLSTAVSTWSNVAGVKAIRPKLLMQSGHVLVRFNLSESVDDQDAIDAQLRQAKLVIKKRQQEYMKANEIAALKGHEAKPIYFLRSLRLLDLLDGKNSLYSQTGRALRLVNGHGEGELTEKEARAKYKQQIGQARRLASDGYRHLANREGCPKPKSFR